MSHAGVTDQVKRLLILLFLAVVPMQALAQPPAAPERRVAFVIGIGAYQHAPRLTNPVSDARAVGEALRQLNFEVDEVYDPDFRQLTHALREFGIKAQQSDVAVIYYAGHGVQVARENYLLPADAVLERERDLVYEALSLDLFLGEIAQAQKLGIILLDACRNNPFVERLTRSVDRQQPRSGLRRSGARGQRPAQYPGGDGDQGGSDRRGRQRQPQPVRAGVDREFAKARAGTQPVLSQRTRQRIARDQQSTGTLHL